MARTSKSGYMKDNTGRRLDEFRVAAGADVDRALLRGNSRIRAMAAKPPYAAPVMQTLPTITESTTKAAANSKHIGHADPALRWPGYIDTSVGTSVRGNTKLDGTRKPSVPYTHVSFDYDGRTFDINYKPSATFAYRIWVNEEASAATMTPVATTGASAAYLRVDLGSASIGQPRRIVIEFSCDNPIVFYGLEVPPTTLVTPPSTSSPRVMIVGDSYDLGLGASNRGYSYSVALGRLMGWGEVWAQQLGVPSTGLRAQVGTTDGPYISRLAADVIPFDPDLLIIQGSINDRPSAGLNVLGSALTQYVSQFRAVYADTPIVVTSPLYCANPIAADLSIRDELKATCATLGLPFVDLFTPTSLTGSGKWGSPNNTGNADFYSGGDDGTDGTHPSKEGHFYIASVLAPRLRAALGLAE